MTDNELLLALSDMMDKKIQPLKDEIRDTKLTLENNIADTKLILENDIRVIKLIFENDISPRLQNIESCYTSTYNRYKNSVDDYEQMQADIQLLKKVVREHSKKLEKIS
ncbi:MAG: hypothetical protein QM793_07325 [Muricomes sp.]